MSPEQRPSEIDERIRAELPPGWGADLVRSALVDESYMTFLVTFRSVVFYPDRDDKWRDLEVEAMGRTVEDLLAVARRLAVIGEALTFPWPIDLEIRSEA